MQFYTIMQHTRVCFVSSTGGCRKWRNAKPRVVVASSTFTYHGSEFAACEKTGEFFCLIYMQLYSFYLAEQLAAPRVAHRGFSVRVTLTSVFSARL